MKCLPAKFFFALSAFILFQNCTAQKSVLQQPTAGSYINGDALPEAPELAPRGEYPIGVRTLDLIHKDQIDILKSKGGSDPLYDRPLKTEVWYPAIRNNNQPEITTYEDVVGSRQDTLRPIVPFTFNGRAQRNTAIDKKAGPYPLVIISHGYPGSRVLLSYLAENLASKGYIVVAIDHTESTHRDQAGFASTLLNRATDILFVLNQLADAGKDPKHFLAGSVDADNTALIGYSMGGYGVLNVAGAGYSNKLSGFFTGITGGSKAVNTRTTSDPAYAASIDPRIKAVVAFAPWGMKEGIWDAAGLKGVTIPIFFVAGSQDDISGYEDGTKAIYNGVTNTDRYLLTYVNARHNTAPNPPPAITMDGNKFSADYYHYAEAAWDQRRINNINQHFVTAFLGIYLQKKAYGKYLELPEISNTKNWTGFMPRSSVGLELRHATKGN